MLRSSSWLGLLLGLGSLGAVLWGFTPGPERTTSSPPDSTTVFMWTGANNFLPEDALLFRTKLAFAARQNIVPYESGIHTPADLRRFLDATDEVGIEHAWIEIGPNDGMTAEAFATDPGARAATLGRFRALARAYKSHSPASARITIFDEAPLGAFSPPDSTSYSERVAAFREYGPKGFALMYRALKDVMPSAEVGIFLHHPHNASPEMAEEHSFIADFMAEAEALGATPDFIYSDVYRGYFNRGYGVEATNDYITDVVRHTRRVADRYGVEAYQLGQVHTIKLGYTPSQWEIDTNVRAMLRGNPDGVGWYWPNYASTNYTKGPDGTPRSEGYDVSFDPFVPNSWGKTGPAGSLFATSRDRFVYSYLRLQEATGRLQPRNRFDLWLYGHDFDHVEHRVHVRPAGTDADWTFIGAVNPQRDSSAYVERARPDNIYSYDDEWHAVVFHGLRRSRHLAPDSLGQRLEVKLTTQSHSDTSRLGAAYALPYRATRHYATEAKATRLIERQPRWMAVNSLAHHVHPFADTLAPGTERTYTLSPSTPTDSSEVARWRSRR